jgi:hypothetical protein
MSWPCDGTQRLPSRHDLLPGETDTAGDSHRNGHVTSL